jgi:hypothetical protein
MSITPDRMPRMARSPFPAVLVGLALALASATGLAEANAGPSVYVSADRTEPGIPAGLLDHRSMEIQTADRSRERGHGGIRRSNRADLHGVVWRPGPALAAVHCVPQDAARRALARAGRLSAPATAPPHLF